MTVADLAAVKRPVRLLRMTVTRPDEVIIFTVVTSELSVSLVAARPDRVWTRTGTGRLRRFNRTAGFSDLLTTRV